MKKRKQPPEPGEAPVVSFEDLSMAFEWVNFDGGLGDNAAYVCRKTGRVYWNDEESEDDLPADLQDNPRYLSVPSRVELHLDSTLALYFVETHRPALLEEAEDYFHRRGAYRNFKAMLLRENALEAWHRFEQDEIERALRRWAAARELRLSLQIARPATPPDVK